LQHVARMARAFDATITPNDHHLASAGCPTPRPLPRSETPCRGSPAPAGSINKGGRNWLATSTPGSAGHPLVALERAGVSDMIATISYARRSGCLWRRRSLPLRFKKCPTDRTLDSIGICGHPRFGPISRARADCWVRIVIRCAYVAPRVAFPRLTSATPDGHTR
jgi:hypothetical protein